jgi:glycerophosphoryl diester phosphodiesterase
MKPVVIAHRGASGYLPEHTRPAKVLAHIMGADYLEQDVVATRDDALVVLHDIHLDTVSDVTSLFPDRHRDDGRFYARDFDLDEIRSLTAWERMNADGTAVFPNRYPAKTGHFRVHTFREEIEMINRLNKATDRQVGIYPEIKRPAWHKEQGVDIAPLLLEQIREFDGSDDMTQVYVQCFDNAEVVRLREELKCPWRLVQLIGENNWGEAASDFDYLRSTEGLEQLSHVADGIGPAISHLYQLDGENLRPTGLVQQAHQLGLTVHPYTFRQDDLPPGFKTFEELVRYCVTELGVDGLFTDFTDLVVDILKDIAKKEH